MDNRFGSTNPSTTSPSHPADGVHPALFLKTLRRHHINLSIQDEALLLDCLDFEQMSFLPSSASTTTSYTKEKGQNYDLFITPLISYNNFLLFCTRYCGHWSDIHPTLADAVLHSLLQYKQKYNNKKNMSSMNSSSGNRKGQNYDDEHIISELFKLFESFDEYKSNNTTTTNSSNNSGYISERSFLIILHRSEYFIHLTEADKLLLKKVLVQETATTSTTTTSTTTTMYNNNTSNNTTNFDNYSSNSNNSSSSGGVISYTLFCLYLLNLLRKHHHTTNKTPPDVTPALIESLLQGIYTRSNSRATATTTTNTTTAYNNNNNNILTQYNEHREDEVGEYNNSNIVVSFTSLRQWLVQHVSYTEYITETILLQLFEYFGISLENNTGKGQNYEGYVGEERQSKEYTELIEVLKKYNVTYSLQYPTQYTPPSSTRHPNLHPHLPLSDAPMNTTPTNTPNKRASYDHKLSSTTASTVTTIPAEWYANTSDRDPATKYINRQSSSSPRPQLSPYTNNNNNPSTTNPNTATNTNSAPSEYIITKRAFIAYLLSCAPKWTLVYPTLATKLKQFLSLSPDFKPVPVRKGHNYDSHEDDETDEYNDKHNNNNKVYETTKISYKYHKILSRIHILLQPDSSSTTTTPHHPTTSSTTTSDTPLFVSKDLLHTILSTCGLPLTSEAINRLADLTDHSPGAEFISSHIFIDVCPILTGPVIDTDNHNIDNNSRVRRAYKDSIERLYTIFQKECERIPKRSMSALYADILAVLQGMDEVGRGWLPVDDIYDGLHVVLQLRIVSIEMLSDVCVLYPLDAVPYREVLSSVFDSHTEAVDGDNNERGGDGGRYRSSNLSGNRATSRGRGFISATTGSGGMDARSPFFVNDDVDDGPGAVAFSPVKALLRIVARYLVKKHTASTTASVRKEPHSSSASSSKRTPITPATATNTRTSTSRPRTTATSTTINNNSTKGRKPSLDNDTDTPTPRLDPSSSSSYWSTLIDIFQRYDYNNDKVITGREFCLSVSVLMDDTDDILLTSHDWEVIIEYYKYIPKHSRSTSHTTSNHGMSSVSSGGREKGKEIGVNSVSGKGKGTVHVNDIKVDYLRFCVDITEQITNTKADETDRVRRSIQSPADTVFKKVTGGGTTSKLRSSSTISTTPLSRPNSRLSGSSKGLSTYTRDNNNDDEEVVEEGQDDEYRPRSRYSTGRATTAADARSSRTPPAPIQRPPTATLLSRSSYNTTAEKPVSSRYKPTSTPPSQSTYKSTTTTRPVPVTSAISLSPRGPSSSSSTRPTSAQSNRSRPTTDVDDIAPRVAPRRSTGRAVLKPPGSRYTDSRGRSQEDDLDNDNNYNDEPQPSRPASRSTTPNRPSSIASSSTTRPTSATPSSRVPPRPTTQPTSSNNIEGRMRSGRTGPLEVREQQSQSRNSNTTAIPKSRTSAANSNNKHITVDSILLREKAVIALDPIRATRLHEYIIKAYDDNDIHTLHTFRQNILQQLTIEIEENDTDYHTTYDYISTRLINLSRKTYGCISLQQLLDILDDLAMPLSPSFSGSVPSYSGSGHRNSGSGPGTKKLGLGPYDGDNVCNVIFDTLLHMNKKSDNRGDNNNRGKLRDNRDEDEGGNGGIDIRDVLCIIYDVKLNKL